MSSYEEWVVDREVEAAWLQFRVRLADYLAAMDERDVLALGIRDADDDWIVELAVSRSCSGFSALWEWADEQDRRHARHGRSIRFSPQSIDSYVLVIRKVLQSAGAFHPSFVEVLCGDIVLVDPPKQIVAPPTTAELPESVTPTSRDDLVLWVDRALTEYLGRPPTKSADGTIGISSNDDRLDIRISGSRPIIEVWATVAKDVDVRRARKLLPKLNATFHFFSFSLVGDRLIMSTTVNAKPFCPEHLERAMRSTFRHLANEAGETRVKVARRTPKAAKVDAAVSNAYDDGLLLVFGAAGDRTAMVQMARDLAHDSRTKLGQWRNAARGAASEAKAKAAEGQHGPVQNALIDQVIAWRCVADAMEDAVAQIVAEREGSR